MISLPEIADNLTLGEDGIWTARTVSPVCYPEIGNHLCYSIEDVSFWFRHRNDCIVEAVRRHAPTGAILDIGGGNGYVARALQDAGWEVVVVEPGPQGACNAFRRGVRHVVRAAFEDAGLLPERTPAFGMFDVLEHVGDQHGMLAALQRCLAPRGRLYLTVPAYQWLWSEEDKKAGHFRRYTLASLSRALERAGFQVEYATYVFSFLPLPSLLLRALPYRVGVRNSAAAEKQIRADHDVRNPLMLRPMEALMRWELRRIRSRKRIPLGGSCLAVAAKR